MTTRSRVRKTAAAATAVTASAALLAGATLGPTAVQSAQSERTVVADPTLAASTSIGGGLALDPEGVVDGYLPVSWDLVKGFFGDSTAIAVLPGVAIAAAAPNESATAFSFLGLAIATTDIPLPIVSDIESGQASCLGVFTFANSSTDGLCLNVLGTFDADYNKNTGEVSAALTNPLALLSLLTGAADPADLIEDIIAGKSISRLLTEDIVRLTLGGPGFAKITSDYAFQEYKNSGGGVVIGWLGANLVLFPVVTGGGVNGQVNYIGLPRLEFGGFPNFSGISNIIPSLSVGQFNTPIFNIPAWSTNDVLAPNSTGADLNQDSGNGPLARSMSFNEAEPELTADTDTPAPAEEETTEEAVVEEQQPELETDQSASSDPVDPPAPVESTPGEESTSEVESTSDVDTPADRESAGETSGETSSLEAA